MSDQDANKTTKKPAEPPQSPAAAAVEVENDPPIGAATVTASEQDLRIRCLEVAVRRATRSPLTADQLVKDAERLLAWVNEDPAAAETA